MSTFSSRSMSLKTKTVLVTTAIALLSLFLLTLVSIFSFRQFSLSTAREHARTAAEIVRVSLTEAMINGVVDKRESFLKRLAQVEGLENPRVFRGPDVVRQFGKGLAQEESMDAIVQQVLASGKPYYGLVEEGMDPMFRATVPFIADEAGTPNCLQCHQVSKGTVLGAVTLHLSLQHLQKNAFITIIVMAAIIAVLSVLALWFTRRMVAPLIATADNVQGVVKQAVEGDFRGRVVCESNDEIGRIADGLNRLMDHLHEGLSHISGDVAQLMRYDKPPQDSNLLVSTMEMVEALVEAAHFKQAIEEDASKREVYGRLGDVLEGKFGLAHYSIYEVNQSQNRVVPVMVDGRMDAACKWCLAEVLGRPGSCRAQRTGRIVDGVANANICSMFRPDQENQHHVCLPLIQSGAVGSVVQLVMERGQGQWLQLLLPLIQVYLRDSAPVLEGKRLMDTLRDSALRDAMTGLHNRRFLEEFMDTLVADTHRKKDTLGVLMVDMDHFKSVNDSYGHEAGDIVIKHVARVIRDTVRGSDLAVRYGGEEFLIILRETCREGAKGVGEKLRIAMESSRITVTGGVLRKTLSVGVACFPEDAEEFWRVVKLADLALYQAKQTGRNRVVVFEESMASDVVA